MSIVGHCAGEDLPETPTSDQCCWGSIIYGPHRCTCWEPVYDLDQQPPQPDLPTPMRPKMCGDCAYRPKSPERQRDPAAAATPETLDMLVDTGQVFWCHQGMRRPVSWAHPSGVTIPGGPLNYCPPTVDGRPYKADGTPGDVCAGWAARFLKRAS